MLVKFYAGKNKDFCCTLQKKPPKLLSMALVRLGNQKYPNRQGFLITK
jgi:hypothetical protein